jgi:glycosyltransferase involved in cell wall biosynthesis
LTNAGKNEIQSWDYMMNKEDNISVIPCCSDTTLFDYNAVLKEDIDSWKRRLGISDTDFVLSYLGSIGTWYMLEEMLDFFVELLIKYPNAKFLFITHDEHDRIIRDAQQRGIADKIIIQSGQRREVPVLLSLSSLSVFFIRPTYSKIASSPTKQGEIMALGIPIVCNEGVGDTSNIVNRYNSGVTVNKFNREEYSKAIAAFEQTRFDKKMIREGAKDYFGLEKGIQSYEKMYLKLEAKVRN